MPRPLLSEALRGHGALLRDAKGDRFVDELLSRDKVSRAITARMAEQATEHVWLDATGLAHFDERFPTIARELVVAGLDAGRDWLPVAPAAHYLCGGVVADLDGATTLPGLWVAGEAACNGVHGANRLASNSLLDGMVFAPRVVEAVERGKDGPSPTGVMAAVLGGADEIGCLRLALPPVAPVAAPPAAAPGGAGGGPGGPDPVPVPVEVARRDLQRAMTTHAGVLRSAASLAAVAPALEAAAAGAAAGEGAPAAELANLVTVGRAVATAATARTESRGAHTRTDHPDTDPALRARLVIGGA
jgi:L-aspartate oxidase